MWQFFFSLFNAPDSAVRNLNMNKFAIVWVVNEGRTYYYEYFQWSEFVSVFLQKSASIFSSFSIIFMRITESNRIFCLPRLNKKKTVI